MDRVNEVAGEMDQTLQGVTGGKHPRLPKVEVQVPKTGLEPTGSGTVHPARCRQGPRRRTQSLPAPGVQLPETEVAVPGTGLRLP